jgi:hypothetical protein
MANTMVRTWTCRSCKARMGARKRKCVCGKARPPKRVAAHLKALELPYEAYVVLNGGEFCGVETCKRERSAKRRLDRDHDHATGRPRGLLCSAHNRMLTNRVTAAELRALADYLERSAAA